MRSLHSSLPQRQCSCSSHIGSKVKLGHRWVKRTAKSFHEFYHEHQWTLTVHLCHSHGRRRQVVHFHRPPVCRLRQCLLYKSSGVLRFFQATSFAPVTPPEKRRRKSRSFQARPGNGSKWLELAEILAPEEVPFRPFVNQLVAKVIMKWSVLANHSHIFILQTIQSHWYHIVRFHLRRPVRHDARSARRQSRRECLGRA